MIIEVRTQLLELIAGKTPDEAVDALIASDVLRINKARDLAIVKDFFSLYGKTSRTANDIDEELADKYGVTREVVVYARNGRR